MATKQTKPMTVKHTDYASDPLKSVPVGFRVVEDSAYRSHDWSEGRLFTNARLVVYWFDEYRWENPANDEPYTNGRWRELFTVSYLAHTLKDEDYQKAIDAHDYKQLAECRPDSAKPGQHWGPWFGETMTVHDGEISAVMLNMPTITKIVDSIRKTVETYNLTYRHHDPLVTMLVALRKLNAVELRYDGNKFREEPASWSFKWNAHIEA